MFVQNTKTMDNMPIIDTQTPLNLKLSAMFKRSFAYFTVKERLPIIITKIIDQLSRDREEIIQFHGAKSDEDVRLAMSYLVKLRNEIMTNKPIAYLTYNAHDVKDWNNLIKKHDHPTYFTAVWLFTECYVYRRIREAFEFTEELKSFDPFRKQKDNQFENSVDAMCYIADQMINVWLAVGAGAKMSNHFHQLLKICLWSNKCDLSLSVGAEVAQKQNPIQFIHDWDDNIIINEFDKLYTYLRTASTAMHKFKVHKQKFEAETKRAEDSKIREQEREAMTAEAVKRQNLNDGNIVGSGEEPRNPKEELSGNALKRCALLMDEVNTTETAKSGADVDDKQHPDTNGPTGGDPDVVCICKTAASPSSGQKALSHAKHEDDHTSTFTDFGPPEEPLKLKESLPHVTIDIVCDNAGYELFTDLCIADFLLTKGFCSKVRFRLKAIPWFISDVTMRDFKWTIKMCSEVKLSKLIGKTDTESSENSIESSETKKKHAKVLAAKQLSSDNLNKLGQRWTKYLKSGLFEPIVDEFWTTSHDFSELREVDPFLYKSLGDSIFIFFKGDLNYRKLMGEVNWNPTTSFTKALQGFHPAPLCAIRTVKADLISGLQEGQMAIMMERDEKWMETGDYGLIQTCNKVIRITPEELSNETDDV